MDSVKEFAEMYGYEYKLWTSGGSLLREAPAFRKLYAAYSKELAGQADILRLLALRKYGGIYIDADSVILKPEQFSKFLETNEAGVFFAWEEFSKKKSRKLQRILEEPRPVLRHIANGVIGAEKGHPFIKGLLEGIQKVDPANPGPAWRSLGPYYTTKFYRTHKQTFTDVKIYPMKYFYPRHWWGITDPELHKKVKIPGESMMFQYGYSTNQFAKIFRKRNQTRRLRRD